MHARLWAAQVVGLGLCAAACASLPSVPEGRPHATLHVRFVHHDGERAYEDTVVLDGAEPVTLRGFGERARSVRVSPGEHALFWSSTGTHYRLQERAVEQRVMDNCAGPVGAPLNRRTMQTTLAPDASVTCSEDVSFAMRQGEQRLLLLIASGSASCRACLRDDLSATSCPDGEGDRTTQAVP